MTKTKSTITVSELRNDLDVIAGLIGEVFSTKLKDPDSRSVVAIAVKHITLAAALLGNVEMIEKMRDK